MRLTQLVLASYRSIREETLELGSLNLLIGANASGKSNALDALRLLHEAVRAKDFSNSVRSRGGIIHLAWKGEAADSVRIRTRFASESRRFERTITLQRQQYEVSVSEELMDCPAGRTGPRQRRRLQARRDPQPEAGDPATRPARR